MSERDINTILLDKVPDDWTPKEADRVKEFFHNQRPTISSTLATTLFQYWKKRCPKQLLFENNIEDNVALLLHARAYGEYVSEPGESDFLGKLLQEYSELFEPLPFLRFPWTAGTVLSPEILAGLDSPIIHAWSYVEGEKLQQILIIGDGLPEISQQIIPATFMTSLQVTAAANDIMNIGVQRVELPGSPVTPLDIPFNIIGEQQPLSTEAAETADAALQQLQNRLEELEKSGLVQVHRVDISEQKALSDAFRNYARQAVAQPQRALLWQGKKKEAEIMALVPYWQTAREATTLSLALSGDLLGTLSYERLLKTYYYATIKRHLMDIGIRRDYYRREANRLEAEKKQYNEASLTERKAIWGGTVLLTIRFNPELGIAIKLAQPQEAPMDTYFEKHVPYLIQEHRKWQVRMEHIIASALKAYERPDAPVRRFATSRFFDAALRGCSPEESKSTQSAFDAWLRQVHRLLNFEWRCLLESKKVKPEQICTPHTFFHTLLTPTQDGLDVAKIVVMPFTLVDQNRSVALFDSQRRVMEVYEATDYTQPVSNHSGRTPVERLEDLKTLAEQLGTTEELFVKELRTELQQAPAEMLEQILKVLIDSHQAGEKATSDEEYIRLEENLANAKRKTEVTRRINQSFLALNGQAFQTARKVLDALEINPAWTEKWAVRVYLIRAIIECRAEGLPIQELAPIFHHTRLITPPAVQFVLEMAIEANEEYVKNWIELLERDAKKAVGLLQRGLPQAQVECSPSEYTALLARSATESARMARELELAAAKLAEQHEAITTAFAKVGWELEKILLSDFAGGPQDELFNLIAVLTGQELPTYPDTGGTSE